MKTTIIVTLALIIGIVLGYFITTTINNLTAPATTQQLYTYYTNNTENIGETWEDWSIDQWGKTLKQIQQENLWRTKIGRTP